MKYLCELLMRLVVKLGERWLLGDSLDEHIGLVVTVERPVILIEATHRHHAAIIYLDGLHVQVFEWFFSHLRPVLSQPIKQIAVKKGLVAGLIAIASRDDFKSDTTFCHSLDELVFQFVNVLHIWLNYPNL